jgi:glycosyltransferase involved in cell wall biosynthesis
MRILHVTTSLNPAFGGPAEGLKQIAIREVAVGHTVEVVTLNDANAPWLQNYPLTVHALGQPNNSYYYSAQLLPWLRAHAHRYDAVIAHGLWQYHSFAVWRTLRNSNTPYFIFTHGMLGPWFKLTYPLKHLKKWLYWPWAEYRVLRDARAVLFTCEEERRLARQSFWLYRCKEVVVGYGITPPSGDPETLKMLFLDRFPGLRDKRLILFLGRIHSVKGCDLLIKAFAEVAAQDDSLHLLMSGPDHSGWQGKLTDLGAQLGINERITWTGMLSGEFKWGAYHAAEVFALPSHHENFGIVVAEALACSVPVLISNKVNIWREIQTDGAGLVDDDDLAGTVRLLQRWLRTTSDQQQEIRHKALNCFYKHFEISAAVSNLLSAIAPIADASGARRKERI